MPKRFLRFFFCKECMARAKLDELTEGLVIVECKSCDINEVWDISDLGGLELFHFRDEKFAEC